jgi:hypothetical protein
VSGGKISSKLFYKENMQLKCQAKLMYAHKKERENMIKTLIKSFLDEY